MKLRRDQKLLLWAGALSLALWAVPFLRPFGLPLLYLNTHIHEIGHALMAHLTGGEAHFIQVFPDGSGLAQVAGGSEILVAKAGYLGAAFAGGALIVAAGTEKGAKWGLLTVAAVLAASQLLWVLPGGSLFGLLSGIFWAAACALMGTKLAGGALVFAAQFVGLQQCLHSFQSLLDLITINTMAQVPNDAVHLQQVTGVPALVWSLLWTVVAVLVLIASLKSAWSPKRGPRASVR